ncbi:hypothetical protein AVEN_148088-1 [Araneus ventricosus]|uniref:Uncharacterized protein n=1 Tax=Araneus ventricosus TaxID=182803 RepID=A0A4Y2G975_ARAVE|nr:hypothetical protein AVEN_148088-1 [Araneus ventricosus]
MCLTVSHAFSISLIALEDCCIVTSSSDKLSYTFSCCETRKLFGGQLLTIVFLRFIYIISHLQSHDLGQRHHLIDGRLHRYYLDSLKVTFDNAARPKLLPRRRVILVTSSHVFSKTCGRQRSESDISEALSKSDWSLHGLRMVHWSLR